MSGYNTQQLVSQYPIQNRIAWHVDLLVPRMNSQGQVVTSPSQPRTVSQWQPYRVGGVWVVKVRGDLHPDGRGG